LQELKDDLRFAFNLRFKQPGFGIVALLTLALGASPGQILRLVMRQSLTLVELGNALANLLCGISACRPVVYGAVVVLLTLVAGVATLIPAWRVARIDPASALRG